MRLANLTSDEPLEYVNGFDNYNMLRKYMDKCSQAMKHAQDNNIKLTTGLQWVILKKLQVDLDKLSDKLLDKEAQHMLDEKTHRITTYAIDMLHYDYNINLRKLLDIDKKTTNTILS